MEHNGNPSPFYFSYFDKKCKNIGILLKVVKGWRPQTIIYVCVRARAAVKGIAIKIEKLVVISISILVLNLRGKEYSTCGIDLKISQFHQTCLTFGLNYYMA